MSQARALTPKQINRALSTCLIMQDAPTKRCCIVLSHAACRVTELAQIRVEDVLTPRGVIKEEVFLRAAICKNYKPRTIWLTNATSRQIIQEYISYRIKKQWGITPSSDQYKGLNPRSILIFNNRGRPYSLSAKRRTLLSGEIATYYACDSIEAQLRSIYKKCGLHGASSHSGRRSYVSNAVLRGVSLEALAVVLGHSSPSHTLTYVQISPQRLAYACSIAL